MRNRDSPYAQFKYYAAFKNKDKHVYFKYISVCALKEKNIDIRC